MSLLELLGQQIDGQAIRNMSQQLGEDPETTSKAVSAALPMLVGALANNTSRSGGAQSLLSALDRDHDGSVLDDVVGFLGQGGAAASGQGILGHLLGGRQVGAEQALGKVSGMNAQKAGQLLAMLAPLVMGVLGRARQQESVDADGLAGMLARERREVERAQPKAGSLLEQVIDRDGDGDVSDDLLDIGSSLLGSFLGGRR
ncbi:MAG: DUF937 domain-containing protein [Holophagales bacterium]|nr:DUF937 domain-containing protein [Holophagales bacterium]